MKMKRQVVYFDNIEEKNALLNYFETNGYLWRSKQRPLEFTRYLPERGCFLINGSILTYRIFDSYDNFLDFIDQRLPSYEILDTYSLIGNFKLPTESDLMDFLSGKIIN